MLTINGTSRTNCSGVTRRELLQIGGTGLFGMTLPGVLAAQEAQQAFAGGKAKSVIFMFLFGGPSQLETFDLKPDAKSEVRGPFKPIKSPTPDLLISEHLGRLAKISDKFAVIRSMTHNYNDHSGAGHYLQTGHRWHLPIGGGFSATPQDWPSMGSVVEHLSQKMPGGMERDLASYAVLPNRLGKLQDRGQYIRPGEYAGWLGQAYNPMTTVIDKKDVKDNPYWRACADGELSYEIEGLKPVIPVSRIQERVGLLDQFEAVRSRLDMGDGDAMDLHRKRAMALISSDKTSSALNIRAEAVADGIFSARAASWRDDLSRQARVSSRCITTAPMATAGTRIGTATMCAIICCPRLIKAAPHCSPISTSADCSMRHSSSPSARWAARRSQTPPGAAATGAPASPRSSLVPEYAAALFMASPTKKLPIPTTNPCRPKISPRRSTGRSASIPI